MDNDAHNEMLRRMRDMGSPLENPPELKSVFVEILFDAKEDSGKLVRDWFIDLFELAGSEIGGMLAADPPRSATFSKTSSLDAGRPWANLRFFNGNADPSSRQRLKVFSQKNWNAFTDDIAAGSVESPEFNAGIKNERGYPGGFPGIMILSDVLHNEFVQLTAMFDATLLYQFDFVSQFLAYIDTFAGRCNPLFGTVDHNFRRTRHEEEEGLVPDDNIFNMRSTLRGFGWITIVPEEIGTALGDNFGLVVSRAFYSVRHLAGGGYMLQATRRFADYNAAVRAKIEKVLDPFLARRHLPTKE